MPGIAAAGNIADWPSHSAAPTGAFHSSMGDASAPVPSCTVRSASRVRSNGRYDSAPPRIVKVSGYGPSSIERVTIDSASASCIWVPAAVHAAINSGSAARPWPSSVSQLKHGSDVAPGWTSQSTPPWPDGEVSAPALCTCITSTLRSNCSSIMRSTPPGASVDAIGLSSSPSVPCTP